MAAALIKLTYKHIINSKSVETFEKNIFQASYREFLFKSQAYNIDGSLQSFTQMKAKDGRANSLHYKVSFAALHFLDELKGKVPALTDVTGGQVKYETPVFELIESSVTDASANCVAIKFITSTLVLHQVIGDTMVLSYEVPGGMENELTETFTVKMQPQLAVTGFCAIKAGIDEVNTFNQPIKRVNLT